MRRRWRAGLGSEKAQRHPLEPTAAGPHPWIIEDIYRYVEDNYRYLKDIYRYMEDNYRYLKDICRYVEDIVDRWKIFTDIHRHLELFLIQQACLGTKCLEER